MHTGDCVMDVGRDTGCSQMTWLRAGCGGGLLAPHGTELGQGSEGPREFRAAPEGSLGA